MKICPRCQKTYADDNLNFCLEDGTVLTAATAQPPQTVQVNQLPVTQPQQMGGQSTGQGAWNAAPQQYAPQQHAQPPKKSSKTWIWVVLILGLLVLLCGGGLVGFFFWAAQQAEKVASVANTSTTRSTSPSPTTGNKSTTTTSTSSRTDLTTVDLNMFVQKFSVYGSTEMVGDEFMMASLQKRFYYVLVAPDKYSTANADTRVTLRNVDDAAGSLGYGLVFLSNPTPLQQDYAFLIDTKKKKYHVVHHTPQNESTVVAWTSSPAIKDGTGENTLEARDQGDKIDLYINGTMVTSIKNVYGYPAASPGSTRAMR